MRKTWSAPKNGWMAPTTRISRRELLGLLGAGAGLGVASAVRGDWARGRRTAAGGRACRERRLSQGRGDPHRAERRASRRARDGRDAVPRAPVLRMGASAGAERRVGHATGPGEGRHARERSAQHRRHRGRRLHRRRRDDRRRPRRGVPVAHRRADACAHRGVRRSLHAAHLSRRRRHEVGGSDRRRSGAGRTRHTVRRVRRNRRDSRRGDEPGGTQGLSRGRQGPRSHEPADFHAQRLRHRDRTFPRMPVCGSSTRSSRPASIRGASPSVTPAASTIRPPTSSSSSPSEARSSASIASPAEPCRTTRRSG